MDALPGRPSQVWVWFKPAHAPLGVVIRVPAATLQVDAHAISVRTLIVAAGLDPGQVATWTVHGATYPTGGGTNPFLDYPLRPAFANTDVEILLHAVPVWDAPRPVAAMPPVVAAVQPQVTAAVPQAAGSASTGQHDSLFAAIDTDWLSIVQLERQCQALRKQLGTLQGKLQSLNRDLSSDEHRVADNQDRKDWQDARRFLRDAGANVSRFIREHDIGITSNAGSRLRFEQIYDEHVVPKKPIDGLAIIQQEFESYRKTVQSVMLGMQSALSNAGRDGEQRAQRVLNRIAAKARTVRFTKPKKRDA